ncbi:G-type lectin S-receptor-like serine/threonine-protein kinase At4g11900, partial [Triticum dicoccoides]|uniref:G-type lectin S-receptor-like serine/threonine-protein kinase At4g11900 n=1 Tax=Triticum dicoccoides TaxID=85692 RepID=UPI0018908F79
NNNLSTHLVAWRAPDDPSTSDYSLGGDSSLQILVWNRTRPYWRRAALDGVLVSAMYQRESGPIMSQTIVNRGGEFYLTYTVSNGSPGMRMVLHYMGMVKFLAWNNNSLAWEVFFERPGPSCDRYASCGLFGYCDTTHAVATCKCLDGYESIGLDFSLGCQRKKQLHCGQGDSFVTLLNMRTPDKFMVSSLLPIQYHSRYPYMFFSFSFVSLSLPLRKKTGALKIVLPVTASLLILVCICLVWIRKLRGKDQTKVPLNFAMLEPDSSDGLYDENSIFLWISYEDIVPATDGFSNSIVLGRGGFGIVYKGKLEGGKEVAVKRLTKCSDQGMEHFRNEVVLIAKLQHRNLVRLLGYCVHGAEKLLIYEYLPNKSLDYFLF